MADGPGEEIQCLVGAFLEFGDLGKNLSRTIISLFLVEEKSRNSPLVFSFLVRDYWFCLDRAADKLMDRLVK